MLSSQMYKEAGFSGLLRASAMGPVTPASPLCASRSFDVAEWVLLSNVLSPAWARSAPGLHQCAVPHRLVFAVQQPCAAACCARDASTLLAQLIAIGSVGAGHTQLASCCACCLRGEERSVALVSLISSRNRAQPKAPWPGRGNGAWRCCWARRKLEAQVFGVPSPARADALAESPTCCRSAPLSASTVRHAAGSAAGASSPRSRR